MKNEWVAYVIVVLLSIAAGVAIAGLPNNVPVDATIIPPTTTEAPEPTVPPTTAAPVVTDPPPTTEAPAPTTPDTEPEETTPDTTEPEDALPDRSELFVTAANGANVAGTASRAAEFLESIGYVDVVPRDGTIVEELTVIYYAEGFEASAVRMAEDWDLLPDFIAPIADAPVVQELPEETQLLAYVGLDRA